MRAPWRLALPLAGLACTSGLAPAGEESEAGAEGEEDGSSRRCGLSCELPDDGGRGGTQAPDAGPPPHVVKCPDWTDTTPGLCITVNNEACNGWFETRDADEWGRIDEGTHRARWMKRYFYPPDNWAYWDGDMCGVCLYDPHSGGVQSDCEGFEDVRRCYLALCNGHGICEFCDRGCAGSRGSYEAVFSMCYPTHSGGGFATTMEHFDKLCQARDVETCVDDYVDEYCPAVCNDD